MPRKNNRGKNRDSVTNTFANMEPATRYEQMAKKKGKGHDTSCSINIHSIRNRLADIDGISGKAAIDGLVHCGVLSDDSPAFVRDVRYSQEKACGKKETTIITLIFD
jgi:hypothetical protein